MAETMNVKRAGSWWISRSASRGRGFVIGGRREASNQAGVPGACDILRRALGECHSNENDIMHIIGVNWMRLVLLRTVLRRHTTVSGTIVAR